MVSTVSGRNPTVSGTVSKAVSTVSGGNASARARRLLWDTHRTAALEFMPEAVSPASETVPETVGFLPETIETV